MSNKLKEKMEGLNKELHRHADLYYVHNNPEISDADYDILFRELLTLEKANPNLVTYDSITQKVGADIRKAAGATVEFKRPMLSLENAMTEEELTDWYNKVVAAHGVNDYLEFICEPKLDGLAVDLDFQETMLVCGATRGDGKVGENITMNVLQVQNIPKRTVQWGPTDVNVRGEVILPHVSFERINKERVAQGKDPYINCRNGAAGALCADDFLKTKAAGLMFMAYDTEMSDALKEHFGVSCQQAALEFLAQMGFDFPEEVTVVDSLEGILNHYRRLISIRKEIGYDIDGMVVKVNDFKVQKKLGFGTRAPNWAIAAKFPAEERTCKLLDVSFQVGRTGAVTPVGNLQTTFVGGANVSRATLHNLNEIARLEVAIGDTVVIRRAGDVVPQIVKVTKRPKTRKEIEWPKECPCCGTKLVRYKEQVKYYCPASDSCPAQTAGRLTHFASRKAMNLHNWGEVLMNTLVEKELAFTPLDIYTLTEEHLLQIEGMGTTMAQKLLRELDKKREVTLAKFIYGLGIPDVGTATAETLANHYRSIEALVDAKYEELITLPDIGPVVGSNIKCYFEYPANWAVATGLVDPKGDAKIRLIVPPKPTQNSISLTGQTWVVTGSLEHHVNREELTDKLKALGAKVTSNVSKKTTALIVGADPGGKVAKAEKLGVKVYTEEEFLVMINSWG